MKKGGHPWEQAVSYEYLCLVDTSFLQGDSGDDSDGLDMDTVDPKLMKDMDIALANVFKVN